MIISISINAQDINYSKFKGKKFESNLDVRLQEPYFKEYGLPFFNRYDKIHFLSGNKYANTPEGIIFEIYIAANKKEFKDIFYTNDVKWKKYKNELSVSGGDTSKNFLILRHRLSFNDNNRKVFIIKYSQFEDSTLVGNYSVQIMGYSGSYMAINDDKYQDIGLTIKSLTSDQFWSLYNNEELDENDYFIAASIRKQVKDIDGTLNLVKLANYIKNNGVDF